MSAPWWDPRALLDGPDVPPSVKSQLVTAALIGADPAERDDWRCAAERAGVTIGTTGLGSADPAREYRDALAAARSAEEAAQARSELAHASGTTVDAMLDAGAVGLRYFEQFLPLAATLAPIDLDISEARRRFGGQRGMDVSALESDAEQVRVQARAAAEQLDRQRAQVSRLLDEQSGVAVDAAGTFLRDHLGRAERDLDHLRRCGDALSAAAHTLWSVVRDKAEMTAGLYTGEVGGRTAAQIALMIESVCGGSAPDHAAAAAVTGWLPAVPGVSASAPVAAVRAACERWLHEVFVPAVQSRCRAFLTLCDRTDAAVDETFRALAALLDETDDRPYPQPGGGAVPSGPPRGDSAPPEPAVFAAPAVGPPGVSAPGASTDSAQSAPEPVGAPPQPDPADWRAAAPNALPGSVSAGVAGVPGLSALVGDFGGQVVRAVSEVGGALSEAAGVLHEAISGPVPPPVPVVMGDFTVALELTPAAMSLQVTGPDGQPHSYAMTIGPDGVPQLTAIEPGDLDAVSDDPRDPTSATSDPITGSADATDAAEPTDDVEPTGHAGTAGRDGPAAPDDAGPQTDPNGAPPASPDTSIDGGAPHDGPLGMVDRPGPEPAEEPELVDRSMPESEAVPEPTPVTIAPPPDNTGARLAESWE